MCGWGEKRCRERKVLDDVRGAHVDDSEKKDGRQRALEEAGNGCKENTIAVWTAVFPGQARNA